MYGNAIVMGMTPMDVDRMSLSQWMAVLDGWNRSHGGDEQPEAPGLDALMRAKEAVKRLGH
ncbi:hypothetical protein [Acuticoccus sediminis]|uniref:hypothetical protein n=1 Tax=Acuticoccus sediminis TaxID=2184697 RepID=UPI001CFF05A1|nr:hypothetical protein [Acuticoccus sediminis]